MGGQKPIKDQAPHLGVWGVKLFKSIGLTDIHISVIEIFSCHTPDKCIIRCSRSAVDTPGWGKHCLFILHPYMPGLIRLAHKMTDSMLFRNFKIKICFHPSVMCMYRHSVPDTSLFKLSHS